VLQVRVACRRRCLQAGVAVTCLALIGGWGVIAVAHSGTQLSCAPTWKFVRGPGIDQSGIASLDGTSGNDVWAVGSVRSGRRGALILHWNGQRWRRTRAWAGRGFAELRDVAAVTRRNAWAVGLGDANELVLRWNGRRWRSVDVPAGLDASLWGVSASASNNVWTVGTDRSGWLILNWNGRRWRRLAPPSFPSTEFSYLKGVITFAPNDVWIAGDSPGRSEAGALAHWNGSTWQVFITPGPASVGSLSATARNDIWATGGWQTGEVGFYHWDGRRWAFLMPPVRDFSTDITAVSRRDAWAVRPLMRWRGRGFRRVKSMRFDGFNTVTAISAVDVWAAGTASGSNRRAVFAHYSC
jgi:hypothetical protein